MALMTCMYANKSQVSRQPARPCSVARRSADAQARLKFLETEPVLGPDLTSPCGKRLKTFPLESAATKHQGKWLCLPAANFWIFKFMWTSTFTFHFRKLNHIHSAFCLQNPQSMFSGCSVCKIYNNYTLGPPVRIDESRLQSPLCKQPNTFIYNYFSLFHQHDLT